MYSAACVDLALSRAMAGEAPPGALHGSAGNPACGDAVLIAIELDGSAIAAARHQTFACPHATAAAELVCRLAAGRDLLDAARIGTAEIDLHIETPESARPCTALAVDALHSALANAAATVSLDADPGRAVVAMSGGVDSAVALTKALAAGLEPVGVTLRLWVDPLAPHAERACCSPEAVRSARHTCHALGVPHLAVDLRADFRRTVVEDFVSAHAAGRTPNPCVRCNGAFRFSAIAAVADRLGASRIVTGHYARVERRAGTVLVARGTDPAKDQSYMLASVPAEILARCWFPLGMQTKARTRQDARAAGLAAAAAPESQEVCFVGGGDHRTLVERLGGAGPPGDIVDSTGRVLGRHSGVHRFTPGQRRGLGLGGGDAAYVLRTEPESGRVVVGPRVELARTSVRVAPGRMYVAAGRVQAKLRYRQSAVWATVTPLAGGGFELDLDEPVDGIAPGQAAVLYDGDAVVGAGTIA
ncbi:MAG TPA: tRNA 2-thiouridine(34) synthase MnmA [Gaiellales bacterium]|nr:tRNA 2-thiouridine(34) synthase MnmA [Gaiellales bacterium]